MLTLFARRLGSVIPTTLAILLVTAAAHAQIPCGYEVTAVIQGPWCPIFGFPPTTGRAVTEDGAVVGHYTSCLIGPSEAFYWSESTGFVTLDRPPGYVSAAAWDIDSETGWIVGAMEVQGTNRNTAVLWLGWRAKPIDLGTLPGGNHSQARATDGHKIVGKWGNNITGDPALGAFLWQDGQMVNIHADLSTPNSQALDITVRAKGVQIVGWMGNSFLIDSHAYIWRDGVVTDLGVIPGGFTAVAGGINSTGTEVVGWGQVPAKGFPFGLTRAFLWREGRMIDIPPPRGFTRSSAADITDGGLVLVNATGPGTASAFIWHDGVITDLNDLIPPELGVEVTGGSAINSKGQITGQAHNDQPGDVVAFLLTPIESQVGDLDGDCAVDILDLLILLSNWGPCADPPDPFPADLDGDGSVGIIDLLTLLANWG